MAWRRRTTSDNVNAAQRALAEARERAAEAAREAAAAQVRAEEAERRAQAAADTALLVQQGAEANTIDLRELPAENIVPAQLLTTEQPGLDGDPDCFYELGCQCEISPAQAGPGDTVIVTVQAVNNNDYPAYGVNVNINFPGNLRFVASIPEIARAPSGGVWNIGRLAPMETAALSVEMLCMSAQPGCVEALVRGSCCDRLLQNNAASSCINAGLAPAADATVALSAPEALLAGEEFPLRVCAKNCGPRRCENAAVAVSIPQHLHIIDADRPGFDLDRYIWCIGNLAAGEAVTLTLTARAKCGGCYTIRACLKSDTPDPDAKNNTAALFINVEEPAYAEVAVVLYSRTKSITERAPFTVYVQLRNEGASRVPRAVVDLPLPPSFQLLCTQGDAYDASAGIWHAGQLLPGQIKLLELTGCAARTGEMVFGARVEGDFINTSERSRAGLSVYITASERADLSALIALSELFTLAGQTVEARLLLTNAGPSQARAALLSLELSEGLSVEEETSLSGSARSFMLGEVPAGATRGVKVRIRGDSPGLKHITLSARSESFDPNPDNNSVCALLEIMEAENTPAAPQPEEDPGQ